MRILKLFQLKERCFLFSLLISLDIIQGPPLVACSNLLVLNPTWTGLFANLKRLGGAKWPPSLAISSQMTMKLGKGILWVEIFTNWQNYG